MYVIFQGQTVEGSVAWGWGPLGILSQGTQVKWTTSRGTPPTEEWGPTIWQMAGISGILLPPVWASELLTVEILSNGFIPADLPVCMCVGAGGE